MKRVFVIFLACLCIACLVLSLVIFVNPTPFIKLYILGIEKNAGLNISFSSATNRLFGKWRFKNVVIRSQKGYGINVENLTFEPYFRKLLEGEYKFECSAQNIKLYGKWPMFEQDAILKTVHATMAVSKGHLKVLKLKAEAR